MSNESCDSKKITGKVFEAVIRSLIALRHYDLEFLNLLSDFSSSRESSHIRL